MKLKSILFLTITLVLFGCKKEETTSDPIVEARAYKMGFTTWSYGPTLEAVDNTYEFIENNGDIYTEHVDNMIPWNALINEEPLPDEFINEIQGKVNRRIQGKPLLLSVSALNGLRTDLAPDFDGNPPPYDSMDDAEIQLAYVKHIDYLVEQFSPDYLVIAIEVNELRVQNQQKWEEYKSLIASVTSTIRDFYPNLMISESITLHNLYEPNVADPQAYMDEMITYINEMDFAAISFYPFLKNLHIEGDMQEYFDYINDNITKPIAFVETSHIAENLVVPNLNLNIIGDEIEQNVYMQTLLDNAEENDYEFVIWWAHRDYDALWATFPPEIMDLGQLWRDTGILDEDGNERLSKATWSDRFEF